MTELDKLKINAINSALDKVDNDVEKIIKKIDDDFIF